MNFILKCSLPQLNASDGMLGFSCDIEVDHYHRTNHVHSHEEWWISERIELDKTMLHGDLPAFGSKL